MPDPTVVYGQTTVPNALLENGVNAERTEKQERGKALRQIVAAFIANTGTLNTGLVFGFSAVAIPQLKAADSLITIDMVQASWIGKHKHSVVNKSRYTGKENTLNFESVHVLRTDSRVCAIGGHEHELINVRTWRCLPIAVFVTTTVSEIVKKTYSRSLRWVAQTSAFNTISVTSLALTDTMTPVNCVTILSEETP